MIYVSVPYHKPLRLGRFKLQEAVTVKVLFKKLAEKTGWGRGKRCGNKPLFSYRLEEESQVKLFFSQLKMELYQN